MKLILTFLLSSLISIGVLADVFKPQTDLTPAAQVKVLELLKAQCPLAFSKGALFELSTIVTVYEVDAEIDHFYEITFGFENESVTIPDAVRVNAREFNVGQPEKNAVDVFFMSDSTGLCEPVVKH